MENQEPVKRNGFNLQLVIVLILAVLLVIFTLQNEEQVSLKLYFWTVENIPVALLITICLLLGYLIPFILLIPRIWKLKSELRQTKEENEELQETQQEPVSEKLKSDPEGVTFDDEEDQNEVDLAKKNFSRRFFKE